MNVEVLGRTVQQTEIWLNEISERLGTGSEEEAYQALRAVLISLRDRIGTDNAAHLSAQLPVLIRGIFYDGFHPAETPSRERTREAFMAKVHGAVTNLEVDPEQAAKAVFEVLARHIEPRESEKLAGMFPAEMRDLWPRQAA
ncbi:DUF2267 domain-containing protein [Stutzerimonas azotifigens]|uniref:DUF2267 domain-containing protein n=1 Tax=Stutzerimonas azotifigens TaxID=291995 RepID=UPI001F16861F|nr:DUF2267 domain-containing protein [Stutzerimonas azotifigens]